MGANNNIPIGPVVTVPISYDCELVLSYIAEDNETYINHYERTLLECRAIPLNNTEDFWNCNLCGSDERYSQPMIAGDVMRVQIPVNSVDYTAFKAYLYNADGDIIEDTNGIDIIELTDGFTNRYLDIKLTADNITADCFYFKVYLFTEEIDSGVLETCTAAKILLGRGPKEAALECLIEQSDYEEYYSEMYRMTNDSCEDTLLLQGTYSRYDCEGNFYGSPQTTSDPNEQYELKIRIPATLEKTEYNFEETVVFNTRRTSKQTDTLLLRTEKLPPYVVAQLALVFNSKNIIIDGVAYRGGTKLSKNFDEGRMWIISTTLTTSCDEIDFLC